MRKTFILDFDDLSSNTPSINYLFMLKEHYPKLKVTLFTCLLDNLTILSKIRLDKIKEWAKGISRCDWIECCPHGLFHLRKEMESDYKGAKKHIKLTESIFKKEGLPFKKIWKSPFWETSDEAYKALMKMGYVVATDPNQSQPAIVGLRTYQHNWSIEREIPKDITEVRGHGHMYTMENSVGRCFQNLMRMPEDAGFKFISELYEK